MQNIRLRRFVASLYSIRYISFSLLGQGPLPREARAPAGLGADQGCGLVGNTAAQPLNLPSRRTRILLALGQASQSEVIMFENAAGRGCVVYITRPTQPLNAWVFIPVKGHYQWENYWFLSRNRVNTQSWQERIWTGGTQRFFVRSYNLEIG